MSTDRISIERDLALHMYEGMVEIREFEDRVYELFLQNLIPGTTHLCQGQEAVSVGTCSALQLGDVVTSTYRGHGESLALGCDPARIMAELMGRANGISRGRGGSMHLHDFQKGLLGTFSTVGAQLPVAAGAAYSFQVRGVPGVAVSFFGDGAANIGIFHETLNLAAVWNLPVVFVCANNLYGEYSPLERTTAVGDIAERAAAYNMPGKVVDGQDVAAVYAEAHAAIEKARSGDGPTLIEAKTYRYKGHSRGDLATYRPSEELEAWLARDPVRLWRERLLQGGMLSEQEDAHIAESARTKIDAAVEFAKADPFPPLETLAMQVFVEADR